MNTTVNGQEMIPTFLLLLATGAAAGRYNVEKDDCLYQTVVCVQDDSCGPLLRLTYALCYELPEYSQVSPDGSLLLCTPRCATALSVLVSSPVTGRTLSAACQQENASGSPDWQQVVRTKLRDCAPLMPKVAELLDGSSRREGVDCWLAGLLCVSRFTCRSLLMHLLQLPCASTAAAAADPCARRVRLFVEQFPEVRLAFNGCACPMEAVGVKRVAEVAVSEAPPPTPPHAGSLTSQLDQFLQGLGRLAAITDHLQDAEQLLRMLGHPQNCRTLRAAALPSEAAPTRAGPPVSPPTPLRDVRRRLSPTELRDRFASFSPSFYGQRPDRVQFNGSGTSLTAAWQLQAALVWCLAATLASAGMLA